MVQKLSVAILQKQSISVVQRHRSQVLQCCRCQPIGGTKVPEAECSSEAKSSGGTEAKFCVAVLQDASLSVAQRFQRLSVAVRPSLEVEQKPSSVLP